MALPRSLVYLGNAGFFLISWLIYAAIFGGWQSHPIAWAVAILPPLGFVYALTALRKNNASLVLAVGSIHPAVTAILAVGFLGEKLSVLQWGLIFGLWSGLSNFVSKIGINYTNPVSYCLMNAVWLILIAFGFLT